MVITSAVLSLFNSSSIELSLEYDRVRLLDRTIGSSSSCPPKPAHVIDQIGYLNIKMQLLFSFVSSSIFKDKVNASVIKHENH